MGFILDGLESEAYDRQYSDLVLLRRILGYFRSRARLMAIAIVAILVRSFLDAGVPLVIAGAVDLLLGEPTVRGVTLLVVVLLVLESSAWVLNWLQQRYAAQAIGDVVWALRRDVFQAVMRHDLSFYDEQPTGRIVSRVTSDTDDFAQTVDLAMNLVSQLLTAAIITAVAFRISARLATLLLALTPVVFAIALSFRHIARKVTQNARRVLARVNANIQESVSGIAVAKAFRREQAMYDEFATLNRQAYRVNLLRGWTINTIFPVLSGSFGVAVAVFLYYGGLSALEGTITVGEWFLFMQAMGYFWFPMTSVASFWSQFQDGLSAAERVFALMDAEPRVTQRDRRPVPRLQGRVELCDVCLTYTGDEVVLPSLSLSIAAGETVALVGHTGAGKTSIGRLLARLYEYQDGEILVDGYDIRTLDLGQYRRQLGFVPQVPFLFSGTVYDNVRYGRPDATPEEVERVARQVGGGDWLDDLPQGLHTDVGERGARLSTGQRQLIALARVLLQDPAIFVLDEATASIDPFTETQIQEGLETVMRDRTSIVIAHRLSTVRNAHRIIVLRDGQIIEEGSHRALMEAGGHYAELYNTYFRHQSADYIEGSRDLAD